MTLLALDAGIMETGWAVFGPGSVSETGVIRISRSRSLDTAGRVAHLVRTLDELAAQWNLHAVAYGQPSGMHWPVPALELLDGSLAEWSERRRLAFYTYSVEEVRAAIARHARVPQDQLAFAIMRRLELIGERKSTSEWEALAIGYYHLCRAGNSS